VPNNNPLSLRLSIFNYQQAQIFGPIVQRGRVLTAVWRKGGARSVGNYFLIDIDLFNFFRIRVRRRA
jgi:hypothetical protein